MGCQLHYVIQGNQNLPVVLFLHGFMGSSEDFAPAIAQLSSQFCCVAVDLPGHGKTRIATTESYTMPATADLVIELLHQLHISHCYLVGYSMGGRLGLYLAIQHPHRFSKLVLESASPGLRTESERQARLQHDRALADRLETDFAAFLSYWYSQPLFHSLRQHPSFEQMRQRRSNNQPHQLAQSLRYLSTGRQPSLWASMQQYTNPLLLLVGEKDRKFQTINQEIVQSCPNAQLAIIPDCGHTIHLECLNAFVCHLQMFLQ